MYIGGKKDLNLLDQYTIETLGLPGTVLMENAGTAVASTLLEHYEDVEGKILVLAGAGNNGGDGFVIARKLSDHGLNVELCLLVSESKIKGDALVHYNVYRKRQLPFLQLTEENLNELRKKINHSTIIVDAMLGTGSYGNLREPYRSVIQMVNQSTAFVLSVDIPSGLQADDGHVEEFAIKADQTVTFVLPKVGFFLQEGPNYVGDWKVVNISVPTTLVKQLNLSLPKLITSADVFAQMPKRPANGHKGTFGHGLVIGGSKQYVGAPIYSAKAAFHTGIGLITLAVPECNYPLSAVQLPESLFLPLNEQNGHLSSTALNEMELSKYKAIAFGPGIGRFDDGEALVRGLFNELDGQPVIIDADGLYFLKNQMQLVKDYEGPVIITPHPGEMATLLDTTVKNVETNRLAIAKQLAEKYNVYVLLKGHRSIIATPEGNTWINPFGHDALGKGGSGDVLTGVILSLLCQGANAEQALVCATFLHARAAELQAEDLSHYGVTPNDIIEGMPQILNKLF
ncbi:NAD(P)H-hydrate dehydratase [Rummeliibacillus sp. NPDC094406]|uniref:NAD(P)H-hydrate dehydratase n=1 Tax=Rummeliibacillus sp. NPDC094406 TaxID=3364511 RepID=UPI0038207D3D